MLLDRFRQTPSEQKIYTIDYSAWLGDGELIVGVESSISPTTSPPFSASAGINATQNALVVTAGSGLDHNTYVLTLLVETNLSQFREDCLQFIVEELCSA